MTKKQTMRFVAACYGGVLAVVLLMNLWHFAADSIGRMTGGITTQQYDFSTMQTQEIDVTSPTQGKATGGDPQLLLENFAGKIIELRFEIAYSKHPGEVNLYYKKAGEEYWVFRLSKLGRVICKRIETTFYIIAIDTKFDLYEH